MPTGHWLSLNAAVLAGRAGLDVCPEEGRVSCDTDGVWRVRTPDGDLQLHGRRPQAEAEQRVARLTSRAERDVVVIVGLGLGYVLEALEAIAWPGRVLAFEPDPHVVRAWLDRRDWRLWLTSERWGLLVGPSYEGASTCRALFGEGTSDPQWIVSPVAARLHPSVVTQAEAVVTRLHFDARATARARREHGARYLLNTLRNVGSIHAAADVARLIGLTPGYPAIVVGAGPSLDDSLGTLRTLRGRAVVIAVDTAARPLLEAGVEPHLIVAVDPGEANARHLVELPPTTDTYLVAEGSLDPAALSAFDGRTFVFTVADHEPWPWLNRHGVVRDRLRAWGSVLTCAYDVACRMGCGPVVFAGSDLAFTNVRPYSRNVTYEEDWRRLAEWGVPLAEQWRQQVAVWPPTERLDVNGAPTATAPHLVAFRDWLIEDAASQQERDVLNATPAGILHGQAMSRASLETLARDWPLVADLDDRIRSAHRQGLRGQLRGTAAQGELMAALEAACAEGDADLHRWIAFAPGVTRERVTDAVRRASGSRMARAPAPTDARALPAWDEEWMAPLARSIQLVPFAVPTWRMERVSASVRRFRPRTTAGRLAVCTLRVEGAAVAEDGVDLAWGGPVDFGQRAWEESLRPGCYFVWRDEFYFTSQDGSDPRENGRSYTVLLPSFVAWLESQSPADIRRLRL